MPRLVELVVVPVVVSVAILLLLGGREQAVRNRLASVSESWKSRRGTKVLVSAIRDAPVTMLEQGSFWNLAILLTLSLMGGAMAKAYSLHYRGLAEEQFTQVSDLVTGNRPEAPVDTTLMHLALEVAETTKAARRLDRAMTAGLVAILALHTWLLGYWRVNVVIGLRVRTGLDELTRVLDRAIDKPEALALHRLRVAVTDEVTLIAYIEALGDALHREGVAIPSFLSFLGQTPEAGAQEADDGDPPMKA